MASGKLFLIGTLFSALASAILSIVVFTLMDIDSLDLAQIQAHSIAMCTLALAVLGGGLYHAARLSEATKPGYSDRKPEVVAPICCYIAAQSRHRTLLAAAVPWMLTNAVFFGKLAPGKLLARDTDDSGLVNEGHRIAGFRMMYSVLSIPGLAFGYLLITRFERYKVQCLGFGAVAALYTWLACLYAFNDGLESRATHYLNMAVFTALLMGPFTTTFMLGVDMLDKERPALFFGIAAGLGRIGGIAGSLMFEQIADMRWRNAAAATICACGLAFTFRFRAIYDERQRLKRLEAVVVPSAVDFCELELSSNGDFVATVLGRGEFSTVLRARWGPGKHSRPDNQVAVKRFLPLSEGNSNRQKIFRERDRMKALDNPHIVKMFGHGATPVSQPEGGDPGGVGTLVIDFFVLELMDGTLEQHLRREAHRWDRPQGHRCQRQLCLDVATGMAYLHSEGIAHRDLKLDNCLMKFPNCDGRVCIGDFGESKESETGRGIELEPEFDQANDHTPKGAWQHSPPEAQAQSRATLVVHRAGNPTPTILPLPVKLRLFKVDVYAFGFIVFRVLDRAAAYEHWLERVVLGAAILPPVHGGDEDLMDEVCQTLVPTCWAVTPTSRPSFHEIKEKLSTQWEC